MATSFTTELSCRPFGVCIGLASLVLSMVSTVGVSALEAQATKKVALQFTAKAIREVSDADSRLACEEVFDLKENFASAKVVIGLRTNRPGSQSRTPFLVSRSAFIPTTVLITGRLRVDEELNFHSVQIGDSAFSSPRRGRDAPYQYEIRKVVAGKRALELLMSSSVRRRDGSLEGRTRVWLLVGKAGRKAVHCMTVDSSVTETR